MTTEFDASLTACNSLALEAHAARCVSLSSYEILLAEVDRASKDGSGFIILGEGSNVVLAGDLNQTVGLMRLKGREVLRQDASSVDIAVAAGENWHELVQWTLEQGLYGLENLALIPGTAGAAPIQNIGAYGVEVAASLQRVHAIDLESGQTLELDAPACELGYRDSIFKHRLRDKVVIHRVELRLSREPTVQLGYPVLADYLAQQGCSSPTPQQVFEAVVSIRRERLPDPAQEPNAGSFFKNPVVPVSKADGLAARYPNLPQFPAPQGLVKLPAAWLIDQCGWKGYCRDGVGVHPGHALVLVNYSSNSGRTLLALARDIQHSVSDRFGVELEIEPRIYGGE